MIDQDVIIANQELRKLKRNRSVNRRDASEKSPFMSIGQVLELVPIGRTKLYLMIADGEFPPPKKLGAKTIVWSKSEVEIWIKEILK